jgi:hypothetical protein
MTYQEMNAHFERCIAASKKKKVKENDDDDNGDAADNKYTSLLRIP